MGFSDEPLGDDCGGSTAMLSPASAVFFPMGSFQPVIGSDCGAVDGYGGAGVALHAIQCYGNTDDTVGQGADFMCNNTLQGVMSCSTWQNAAEECNAYYSAGQSSDWGACATMACFVPAAFLVEAPKAESYEPETYEVAAYDNGGPWPEQWVYGQPAGPADTWPVDYRPDEFNASAEAHEQARSQALRHARRLFGQM
jgi:hypothetical protein